MADTTIKVTGLNGLERAFKRADKDEAKLLRATLKATAEPVRRAAEGKAVSRIRNIGGPWSGMRIGQARSVVYVAPKKRSRNAQLRRPNLKDLLLDRAMIPALEEHREEVVQGVERMLDTVGSRWERA